MSKTATSEPRPVIVEPGVNPETFIPHLEALTGDMPLAVMPCQYHGAPALMVALARLQEGDVALAPLAVFLTADQMEFLTGPQGQPMPGAKSKPALHTGMYL